MGPVLHFLVLPKTPLAAVAYVAVCGERSWYIKAGEISDDLKPLLPSSVNSRGELVRGTDAEAESYFRVVASIQNDDPAWDPCDWVHKPSQLNPGYKGEFAQSGQMSGIDLVGDGIPRLVEVARDYPDNLGLTCFFLNAVVGPTDIVWVCDLLEKARLSPVGAYCYFSSVFSDLPFLDLGPAIAQIVGWGAQRNSPYRGLFKAPFDRDMLDLAAHHLTAPVVAALVRIASQSPSTRYKPISNSLRADILDVLLDVDPDVQVAAGADTAFWVCHLNNKDCAANATRALIRCDAHAFLENLAQNACAVAADNSAVTPTIGTLLSEELAWHGDGEHPLYMQILEKLPECGTHQYCRWTGDIWPRTYKHPDPENEWLADALATPDGAIHRIVDRLCALVRYSEFPTSVFDGGVMDLVYAIRDQLDECPLEHTRILVTALETWYTHEQSFERSEEEAVNLQWARYC